MESTDKQNTAIVLIFYNYSFVQVIVNALKEYDLLCMLLTSLFWLSVSASYYDKDSARPPRFVWTLNPPSLLLEWMLLSSSRSDIWSLYDNMSTSANKSREDQFTMKTWWSTFNRHEHLNGKNNFGASSSSQHSLVISHNALTYRVIINSKISAINSTTKVSAW